MVYSDSESEEVSQCDEFPYYFVNENLNLDDFVDGSFENGGDEDFLDGSLDHSGNDIDNDVDISIDLDQSIDPSKDVMYYELIEGEK